MDRSTALRFQVVLQVGEEALQLLWAGEPDQERLEQLLADRSRMVGEIMRLHGEDPDPDSWAIPAQAVAAQTRALEDAMQAYLERLRQALSGVRASRGSVQGVRSLLASRANSSLLDTKR